MIKTLERSYMHCREVARRRAENFYYSFLALPALERRAMCALYAFLRTIDDIGDGGGSIEVRRQRLDQWRHSLRRALQGQYNHPVLPALHHTMNAYAIPASYLFEVLDGVEMDLGPVRYQTFSDLRHYCYRVASLVGLACIHIWGYRDEIATRYACDCGIAFQLTNILRDIKEDAQQDRIYLPEEDLQRFDYRLSDLQAGQINESFRRLMRFQVQRAKEYYQRGARLVEWLDPIGRPVFRAMHGIYSGLLHEIERRRYDVFSRRVHLPAWQKVGILMRSWLPPWMASRWGPE